MPRRQDRDWTIVQMQYRDPRPVSARHPAGWESRCERYIVNCPLKSQARAVVADWLEANPWHQTNLHEVSYYPRNYVDHARELRATGRVIA